MKKPLFSQIRAFTVALIATFLFGSALNAGNIVGRAVDANTGSYLPAVSVEIPGLNRSAVTDANGRYRLSNVPAGSHSIRFRYIGYDDVVQQVQVPATGDIEVAARLGGEIIELAEFEIEGYREGRSLALQQKRSAGNLMDLISADSVGSLPDRNVAEALARVPGVSLDVDSGEGRFVSIRGMEPNFNTVTYNGVTTAAPTAGGREGRAMPLDVIGSSQITQIEVIKSITPDMDGNSLGGTINIKSASGYDRENRFIFGKFELGDNNVASGTIIDTDITYGDTFNDGKVALALSANYSNRPYASQELQAGWGDEDGVYFPDSFELQPREGERERFGVNFNLQFRPDDLTEIYLFGLYNQFNDEYRQQEFIIESRRDPVFSSPTLINVDRMRFEQRDFQRATDQEVINVTGGIKKQFDQLKVTADVTYSNATEDVPFIKSVQFRSGNLDYNGADGNPPPFQYEFSGFYPAYNDQDAYTSGSPEVFPLRRFREEDSLREEEVWTPRIDFEWDYEDLGGFPGTIKAGAKYTARTRFIDDNSARPVSADGFDHTMADLLTTGPGFSINDGRYMYPTDMNLIGAFEYLKAHPDEFESDPVESAANSIEDDYDITEDILGLYLMGTVDWSERLQMIYGIRYEKTDADLTAFELQEGETADGDVLAIVTNNSTFDYDNWLPNLQFRYDVTDNSILRFAATATIGRPQYEKAAPISVLEYEQLPDDDVLDSAYPYIGQLEIGNPSLQPYESLNFDLAYEYYFQSGAMVSAGLFYKSIDNPIYEFSDEQDNVVYNDISFENLEIASFQNADSATITGLELNMVLPFSTFISGGFLDGFGVDANATFIESNVDVIDREDEDLPFFRQPSRIYNLAGYYQKYGFSFRVAWNYQDESVRELSGDAADDQWDMTREYVDVQGSYKISENLTVYATWKNITDEPKNRSYGQESGRMRRSEFYGSDVRAGIRFLF